METSSAEDGHSPGGCGMPSSTTNSSQKTTAPDNATSATWRLTAPPW